MNKINLKNYFLLKGILLILFGTLFFFFPEGVIKWLIIFRSIEFLCSGCFGVFLICYQKDVLHKNLILFSSIIQILIGLVFLIFPELILYFSRILVVLLGILFLIRGIYQIIELFSIKKSETTFLSFLIGGGLIFFGIFLITNAYWVFISVNKILAIFIVFLGIFLIFSAFGLRKKKEKMEIDETLLDNLEESSLEVEK